MRNRNKASSPPVIHMSYTWLDVLIMWSINKLGFFAFSSSWEVVRPMHPTFLSTTWSGFIS